MSDSLKREMERARRLKDYLKEFAEKQDRAKSELYEQWCATAEYRSLLTHFKAQMCEYLEGLEYQWVDDDAGGLKLEIRFTAGEIRGYLGEPESN